MAAWSVIGWPLLIVVGVVVTFEATMAVTIMTVPDRRKRPWTPADRARVRMIWVTAWGLWPVGFALYGAYVWLDTPWVWAAQATVLVLGVLAWRHVRHGQRRADWHDSGHCPRCGYDLQGTPDADDCPECGQALHEELVCPDTGKVRLDAPPPSRG
ncbi:MAG: zinc ribbon domain-containing protein [Planctomycetota bacterium]